MTSENGFGIVDLIDQCENCKLKYEQCGGNGYTGNTCGK